MINKYFCGSVKGLLIAFLCVGFLATVIGCESLHKKFTREKKKTEESQFIPVLEPVDYPLKSVDPQEKYRYHYSMWSVWQRDLLKSIDEKGSIKQLKYLTSQMILQLEEMGKLLDDKSSVQLMPLIDQFKGVELEWNKSEGLRNDYLIKDRLERTSKEIRHLFKTEANLEYKKSM